MPRSKAAVASQDLPGVDAPYILPGLRHLARPVTELEEDQTNARSHPSENVAAIRASLKELGQHRPAVCRKGESIVRVGNGMLRAARELGWRYLAVLEVEESELDAIRRGLADNLGRNQGPGVVGRQHRKQRLRAPCRPHPAPGRGGPVRQLRASPRAA
jgi:hypothetical protein